MRVSTIDNNITIKPLQGKVITVFKHEPGRSTVWLESDGCFDQVIKRFETSPIRQMFLAILQIHPGQCEKRAHAKLDAMGVPVVSIDALVWQGGKCCLKTAHVGPSLDRAVSDGLITSPVTRHQLTRDLGRLTGMLLARHLFFRDLKFSNIVRAADDCLLLIDAGSVRKVTPAALPQCMMRMLGLLQKTAEEALSKSPTRTQLFRTDTWRYTCAMLAELPDTLAEAMRNELGIKSSR